MPGIDAIDNVIPYFLLSHYTNTAILLKILVLSTENSSL